MSDRQTDRKAVRQTDGPRAFLPVPSFGLPSNGKQEAVWPTECPAYLHWYELLYPERSLTTEEKFQVLCTTYIALNQKRNCSIPEALAQTCWLKMEKDENLHVDEDN